MFLSPDPCGGAYAIACGLDQAIDYIKDLHFEQEDIDYLRSTGFFQEDFLDYLKNFRFTGDIYAIPEGTIIFPKEPLVKVIAPIMEAQLVETALLNIINHQSLIATKAPVSFRKLAAESRSSVFAVPRDRMPVSTVQEPP